MKNLIDIYRPEGSNLWREMNALQRTMDKLFEEIPRLPNAPSGFYSRDIDFIPSCDLEETNDHYLVSVDVPGIPKDQIEIDLKGNVLTVSGEKKEEKREEKGGNKLFERYQGRFERSFLLPDAVSSERVEAEYKDGVLRIAVPKEPSAKNRKVPITDGKSPGFFSRFLGKTHEKKEQKSTERAA